MSTEYTTIQITLNVLSGLLTPVIAIIATWIAIMQMRTHRYQVRIALFERRMKIFEAIRENLGEITTEGSAMNINWKDFYFAVQQSKFLLSNDLQKYIQEIFEKAREMRNNEIILFGANGKGGLPVGEKRNELCVKDSKLNLWLIQQSKPLENKFADFMKMNKI